MLQTPTKPVEPVGGSPGDNRMSASSPPPKAKTACVYCRHQKMKCRIEQGQTCRRCQRAGVPCVFKPRANAASHRYVAEQQPAELVNSATQSAFNNSILARLSTIEAVLGLHGQGSSPTGQGSINSGQGNKYDEEEEDDENDDPTLRALWRAISTLKKLNAPIKDAQIWSRSVLRQLWLSFHDTMPGLHFMPSKQTFSAPRPLLLASMLYTSALRGPKDVAALAPDYFSVLCKAIAQLSMPHNELDEENAIDTEEWAFQTVLGIILAGLLSEAATKTTGIWISIAYRLVLEHSPAQVDERSREWKKLFCGLQIVDLEHASLHLSCPVIPIEAPLAKLQVPLGDQLYSLSRMMHTGLTHFTGRGIPTIWSCFNQPQEDPAQLRCTFTNIDAAVIRDWARQLDEWLARFTNGQFASDQDHKLIYRQYILHRLLVLSIYHPARGFNLFSYSTTPKERHELLVSARAALRLHLDDRSIWSNWDLIMITWAALIVLQGAEGGIGEADDLQNIRIHLELLRETHEPEPSFRRHLANRLEVGLQGLSTPTAIQNSNPGMMLEDLDPQGFGGYPWAIFDEASLREAMYGFWAPVETQTQEQGR